MGESKNIEFSSAAIIIKEAIVRSRYQAAKLVNKELLSLYYAVGKYVSDNSRVGVWGKGAIRQLSENLQRELPGLRGFSEASIKRMRLFYEGWQPIFLNRPLPMDDLTIEQNLNNWQNENRFGLTVSSNDNEAIMGIMDLSLLSKHISDFAVSLCESIYVVKTSLIELELASNDRGLPLSAARCTACLLGRFPQALSEQGLRLSVKAAARPAAHPYELLVFQVLRRR